MTIPSDDGYETRIVSKINEAIGAADKLASELRQAARDFSSSKPNGGGPQAPAWFAAVMDEARTRALVEGVLKHAYETLHDDPTCSPGVLVEKQYVDDVLARLKKK